MYLSKCRSHRRTTLRHLGLLSWMTSILFFAAALPSHAAPGRTVTGNTPHFVADAKVLGHEESTKVIEVSLWLEPHNRSEMDELAHSLYDANSPNYRHWLKSADIAARFA